MLKGAVHQSASIKYRKSKELGKRIENGEEYDTCLPRLSVRISNVEHTVTPHGTIHHSQAEAAAEFIGAHILETPFQLESGMAGLAIQLESAIGGVGFDNVEFIWGIQHGEAFFGGVFGMAGYVSAAIPEIIRSAVHGLVESESNTVHFDIINRSGYEVMHMFIHITPMQN